MHNRYARTLAVLLFAALPFVRSEAQSVRSLDVTAVLEKDGSGRITQVWDVEIPSSTGWTEWYIPVTNLKDMKIYDLTVEEDGRSFITEDRWNTDRPREKKAGRCGILPKGGGGVELCWGIGEYGRHVWKMSYSVTGLVKSLEDYDVLHYQFVNDELPDAPETVTLSIVNNSGEDWNGENTLFWGFGFDGETESSFPETINAYSTSPFGYSSSLIMLCRFEKGIFSPEVSEDKSFEQVRKQAFEGSSYSSEDVPFLVKIIGYTIIFVIFVVLLGFIGLIIFVPILVIGYWFGYKYSKSYFNTRKITGWYRDIPMDNDIFSSFSVLNNGMIFSGSPEKNLPGVFFLRWILNGIVRAVPGDKPDRLNLAFPEEKPSFDDPEEADLYNMAFQAAGKNHILESKEFEKWSRSHYTMVSRWPDNVNAKGKIRMREKGWMETGRERLTAEGKEQATHLIEFKNFLSDFTLSNERGAVEVGLWKEYLIFAQLFGIADKVGKEFNKLYPDLMEKYSKELGMSGSAQVLNTVRIVNVMGRNSLTTASQQGSSSSSSASRGYGGHSSFGGGGGFSGGGHGGGGR